MKHLRLAAGFAAVGLLLAACSESDTKTSTATTTATAGTSATTVTTAAGSTSAPTTAGTAATTTVAGAAPTTGASATTTAATTATTAAGQDVNAWALKYTGGKAVAAAGDPIKIGYANDESFFPENTIGINAGVAYVNAELGGGAGRPLQIVACNVTDADSGSKCGAQFSNDATITLVVTGTMLAGNAELYKALDGKKPVIIGNGLTTDDFTTTAGQTFTAGSPAVIPGMAQFLLTGLPAVPKNVVIMGQDNAGSKTAAQALFEPVMKKAGINVTEAFVGDSAAESDVQTALTAAGVDKADVIVSLNTIQQCINLDDALKALNLKTTVVATGLCFGTPMTDHLKANSQTGDVPDGWYFGDYGYSYFTPDYDSGMLTYVTKVKQYGKPAPNATTLEYTGFAGPSFANILTATKFFNALGADKLDYASVNAQIRGFKGPMMIQAGPLDCGNLTIVGLPIFKSACAPQMGIHEYTGGKWVAKNDGVLGNAIDATKVAV